VARFDRFARSVSHLLRALEEFNHLAINFVSLSESIDTSTPMGKMIFTVVGAVAELERNLIKERVHMGISRARKEGSNWADHGAFSIERKPAPCFRACLFGKWLDKWV
jgi:DNA invertase Pin-like site-specific DNA recombinase